MAIASGLALAASPARAESLSLSDSFSGVRTELVNQPLRASLFDPGLGTLNSVVVTLGPALHGAGTVGNNAAGPESFTVSTRALSHAGTRAGAGPAALPSSFDAFAPFSLIGSQIYTDLAPLTPVAFGPFSVDSGAHTVLSSNTASVLSQFLGLGNFGYDLSTTILTSIQGGGGNAATNIETHADGLLTVTYNDTAPVVPELETYAMVLGSLGLLGFVARRRRVAEAV